MSVNLHVVAEHRAFIVAGVTSFAGDQATVLYGFARLLGLPCYHRPLFAMVLAQVGEFSFASFNEAWDNHFVDLGQRDVLAVVVSLGVVPILIKLLECIPERLGGMAELPLLPPAASGAPEQPDAASRAVPA